MHIANPDGITFCVLARRAIFLDIRRDRYFAASPDATQALTRAIEGTSILGTDEALLLPLLNAGLLCVTDKPVGKLTPTMVTPASCDVKAVASPQATLIIVAIWLQLRAQWNLRRRGLAAITTELARAIPDRKRLRPVEEIAAAARASDLLISAHQRCLMKSIALFDLLIRNGHRPTLVLGVRDDPFTAHAWVQVDEVVVGDRHERIALYQPILAV